MRCNKRIIRCHIILLLVISQAFLAYGAGEDGSISKRIQLRRYFIENSGQIISQDGDTRDDIDFKIDLGDVSLFIGAGAMHYQWVKKVEDVNANSEETTYETYRLDISLIGAKANAEILKDRAADSYYEHYYLPQTPDGAKAYAYSKVTYANIYPNIDWVIYTTQEGEIKYDFIVRKGGDANDIRLIYNGHQDIFINEGNLVVTTPLGSIEEKKPYTYDAISGKEIPTSFVLDNNSVGFHVQEEVDNEIVIDPSIVWSTYYGGSNEDLLRSLNVSKEGQIYACGSTRSMNILTKNSFKNNYTDNTDGLIVRFDTTGNILWSTYYGESDYDYLVSIAVDDSSYVYVAGSSSSLGLATTNTHLFQHPSNGVHPAGLVLKFDSLGNRVWGTYYGGSETTVIHKIICDHHNNIYISGETECDTGIATQYGHQNAISVSSSGAGFFAKLQSNSMRTWGSYYGGAFSTLDLVSSITVSYDSKYIAIAGVTKNKTDIATSNVFQENLKGDFDGYVAFFDSACNRQWGSYFGGEGYNGPVVHEEVTSDVAIDRGYNVYITGASHEDSLGTAGTYQPQLIPSRNGTLAKFNVNGQLVWSTYIGLGLTGLTSITLDTLGSVYVLGVTADDGLATPGIVSDNLQGGYDVLLAKFNTQGNRVWSTYIGGSGNDDIGIATSGSDVCVYDNKLHFSSSSFSTDLITTPGVHQMSNAGGRDGYVIVIELDTSVYLSDPYDDTLMCLGEDVVVDYFTTTPFRSGNTFTLQLSDSGGDFSSPVILGVKSGIASDSMHVTVPANSVPGENYRLRIISSLPADTFSTEYVGIHISSYPRPEATGKDLLCKGDDMLLYVANRGFDTSYAWRGPNGFTSNTDIANITNVKQLHQGRYILSATYKECKGFDTVDVVVNNPPLKPQVSSNPIVCTGDTLHLQIIDTSTNVTYRWVGPDSFTCYSKDTILAPVTMSMQGEYSVYTTRHGCVSELSKLLISVTQTPRPISFSNTPLCEGDTLILRLEDTVAKSFVWSSPQGVTYNTQTLTIVDATINDKGLYIITANNNGCIGVDSTYVTIDPYPGSITLQHNSPLCEKSNLEIQVVDTSTGVSYEWQGPGGFNTYTKNLKRDSIEMSDAGQYTIKVNRANCVVRDSLYMEIKPSPDKPIVETNSPITIGEMIELKYINPDPRATIQWYGPVGFSSYLAEPVIINAQLLHTGEYVVIADLDGCKESTFRIVVVEERKETDKLILYPNPNNGDFRFEGEVPDDTIIPYDIMSAHRQIVFRGYIQPIDNRVETSIELSNTVFSGVYFFRYLLNGKINIIPFTVVR